uniref:Cytochrome c oxidase assembly factor 3 n=1 Tax=Rhabditophanes sp. KR3021 TaxID=114890 RepID=A0AC35TPF3_9BILA
MRIPDGVKAPLFLRLRSKIPGFNKFSKVSAGSVAVFGVVTLTVAALYEVILQPKINHNYYKESQVAKRALIQGSREELANGQRPWSDPFKSPK